MATEIAPSHEMTNSIRVPRAPQRPILVSHIPPPTSPTQAIHSRRAFGSIRVGSGALIGALALNGLALTASPNLYSLIPMHHLACRVRPATRQPVQISHPHHFVLCKTTAACRVALFAASQPIGASVPGGTKPHVGTASHPAKRIERKALTMFSTESREFRRFCCKPLVQGLFE
jgi:hypothetical protein